MTRVSAPGAPSIDCLPVLVKTRSITASKCISKLPQSRPPSAYPNSLNRGLQVHLQTRSIAASQCISKVARSRPPSASPNSLDLALQLHLQTRSIAASKCISKVARSQPSSVSLILPDYGLQVRTITACKRILKLARSQPRSVSLRSLNRHFQVHLELLSSIACSQSRYTVCRLVAIYRYIDT
jgi:hypothetical protein